VSLEKRGEAGRNDKTASARAGKNATIVLHCDNDNNDDLLLCRLHVKRCKESIVQSFCVDLCVGKQPHITHAN
jgi:hypothetical protein